MRISYSQLVRLSVETVSGTKLGKVKDIIMEVDGQSVIQYLVKKRIGGEEYLISRDQIASMTEEKMVVYDTAVSRKVERERVQKEVGGMSPEPVVMRNSEGN